MAVTATRSCDLIGQLETHSQEAFLEPRGGAGRSRSVDPRAKRGGPASRLATALSWARVSAVQGLIRLQRPGAQGYLALMYTSGSQPDVTVALNWLPCGKARLCDARRTRAGRRDCQLGAGRDRPGLTHIGEIAKSEPDTRVTCARRYVHQRTDVCEATGLARAPCLAAWEPSPLNRRTVPEKVGALPPACRLSLPPQD